jgi:hypothetical protein
MDEALTDNNSSTLPLFSSSINGIRDEVVGETTLHRKHHFVAIVLVDCGLLLFFPFTIHYWDDDITINAVTVSR